MAAVAVLAGGPSNEHDVSLATGANVLGALREGGHAVRPVFLGHDGGWHFGALDASGPRLDEEQALASLHAAGETVWIALHGAFGEDGRVQRLLERAGVPYTGSGPAGSELAMDKQLMKVAATKVGARTARHEVVGEGPVSTGRLVAALGLPLFVKPNSAGSSVGVTRVAAADALRPAVEAARVHDREGRALVEEFIDGPELTCGLLRVAGELRVLPLIEIHPAGDAFYDYHAKYVAEDTRYLCPAPVSDAVREEIEHVARELYERLELRGAVRADFLLDRARDLPVFLELNTLPGFTTHSLVPMAARAAGLSLGEVVDAVLQDAWKPA